ncbi:putative Alpha-1,3-mannosyl-glycoprotein 4-beta-N-acetylglucosaminyltransferase B [Hypsibius exemplaris]|uniref:Alpha-1,3-mannosyl-glycoprotein 4-beta-N-acetylglucosaminyltransferase B n=1 Tax=Hypsibius exemplaris TaxID=2072580 RepID=A0A1W0X2B2_HYPEX|nr:putative Alpha-1,3-mannosyl-glycoprotein 4-beta-N-acetylglucosaminyltransferase B [Hypsibius exemplaris]
MNSLRKKLSLAIGLVLFMLNLTGRFNDYSSAVTNPDGIGSSKQFKLAIGVPTVSRPLKKYLAKTLEDLLTLVRPYKNTVAIQVLIADIDGLKQHATLEKLGKLFPAEIFSGLLKIATVPNGFYGRRLLDTDPSVCGGLNGPSCRFIRWRNKQNLDYSYLMGIAANISEFYVQLEDDVQCNRNFLPALLNAMSIYQLRPWVLAEASPEGFIGKMFPSEEARSLAQFLYHNYNVKACDLLYPEYVKQRPAPIAVAAALHHKPFGRLSRMSASAVSSARHGCYFLYGLVVLEIVHFNFVSSQQSNQYGSPIGAEGGTGGGLGGLSGLDANILREIAAALNPARQYQGEQTESPQPAQTTNWGQSLQSQPSIFSAGVSPSCTGKGGFFPDYSQKCRVYYRCSPSGRMARFECPMNYVFSEQLKRCDQPERVACTGKAYESLQPQSARAILPDNPGYGASEPPGYGQPIATAGTQHRLHSGNGGLNQITHAPPTNSWSPTLTYNDQASGFYETLLSAVNEHSYARQPPIKIMGDPQVTLDMDPDICFGRTGQYIPDPDTGCRGYVKCPADFAKPFDSFICPTGMRFDMKTEQCLPRGQVRCMEVERLLPPGFGLDVFARTNPTGNPSMSEGLPAAAAPPRLGSPSHQPPAGVTLSPCAGKTGFVPDYSHQCKVYYYCNADGTSLNLTCPAEMVFNPALQSCDFFQTAPECKVPIPTPQKMRPLPGVDPALGTAAAVTTVTPATTTVGGGVGAGKPSESRLSTSPTSNQIYKQPRALLPFLHVTASGAPTKRPSPGVENQSTLLSPGLLISLPDHPNEPPSSLNHVGSNGSPPQPDTRNLEGFGHPEPVVSRANPMQTHVKWPAETMSNKVNTGPEFAKFPLDLSPQVGFLPKRIGQSMPGSGLPTFYETECDGTVGFYIEPEAGCRIYHFCHSNMTMETFSCPANEVFLLRTKSCVSNTMALCIDKLSGDARDILHKNWDATTLTPVATTSAPVLAAQSEVLPVTIPAPVPAPQPSVGKCHPGVNGMYGDMATQCVTYTECAVDGGLITHRCPPNLKFNSNLKACDWPEYIDVNCNEIKRTII